MEKCNCGMICDEEGDGHAPSCRSVRDITLDPPEKELGIRSVHAHKHTALNLLANQ